MTTGANGRRASYGLHFYVATLLQEPLQRLQIIGWFDFAALALEIDVHGGRHRHHGSQVELRKCALRPPFFRQTHLGNSLAQAAGGPAVFTKYSRAEYFVPSNH